MIFSFLKEKVWSIYIFVFTLIKLLKCNPENGNKRNKQLCFSDIKEIKG